MPDPKKFKDQASFMEECMHQTLKVEGKKKDQAVAQCLNMWRNRNKKKSKKTKSAADIIRDMAEKTATIADNPLKNVSLPKPKEIEDPERILPMMLPRDTIDWIKETLGPYYDKVHWFDHPLTMEWAGPDFERKKVMKKVKEEFHNADIRDEGFKLVWRI